MMPSREIDPFSDAKVVDSWRKNAEPWTQAIRDDLIESRRLVTNRAIVDAVLALAPRSVLDIGCGEGWLARALAPHGVRVTGVDAIPTLIERANQLGGGEYRVASYDDIAAGKLDVVADVAVANFALIGKEAVDALVRRLPRQLTPSGSLVIQTLHPVVAGGDLAYKDGWRPGSWSGFGSSFTDPAPWYFRTLESWVELLVDSGFAIGEIREPLHPTTGKPASVIFVARVAG